MIENYESKVFMFEVGARLHGSHASAPPYCQSVSVTLEVDSERFEESLTRQKHLLSKFAIYSAKIFCKLHYVTFLMSKILTFSNCQVFEMSDVECLNVKCHYFQFEKIRYTRNLTVFEQFCKGSPENQFTILIDLFSNAPSVY